MRVRFVQASTRIVKRPELKYFEVCVETMQRASVPFNGTAARTAANQLCPSAMKVSVAVSKTNSSDIRPMVLVGSQRYRVNRNSNRTATQIGSLTRREEDGSATGKKMRY